MHELEHGWLHRFKDWPIDAVPKEPGIYTVWNEPGEFLYVGIALEGKNGLRGRLGSHANGRRGGDQFNVYVADRLVLRLLDADQIASISAGKLLFDRVIRDYIRDNLGFRFSSCSKFDAENMESRLKTGRWPHGNGPGRGNSPTFTVRHAPDARHGRCPGSLSISSASIMAW